MDLPLCKKSGATEAELQKVQQVVNRAITLEELIDLWAFKAKNTLVLGTGIDDDGMHTLLAVCFSIDSKEIAHIYLPIAELPAEHLTLALTNTLPSSTHGMRDLSPSDEALEQIAFEMRAKQIQAAYCDTLCQFYIPRKHLLAASLSYALCNIGEAFISLASPESLEECDFTGTKLESHTLAEMNLSYQKVGSKRTVHEILYVDLGMQQ